MTRFTLLASGATLTVALQNFRFAYLQARINADVTGEPDTVEVWRDNDMWRIEAVFITMESEA